MIFNLIFPFHARVVVAVFSCIVKILKQLGRKETIRGKEFKRKCKTSASNVFI